MALNPKPEAKNPKPRTLNPKLSRLHGATEKHGALAQGTALDL